MSKPKTQNPDPFMSIDDKDLDKVAGGAARVTARSSGANDQIMAMMTTIGDSIKQLAAGNQGQDPMQMMMMMMMMGGMGGGGGSAQAAAPAPAPAPPTINISTSVRRGC